MASLQRIRGQMKTSNHFPNQHFIQSLTPDALVARSVRTGEGSLIDITNRLSRIAFSSRISTEDKKQARSALSFLANSISDLTPIQLHGIKLLSDPIMKTFRQAGEFHAYEKIAEKLSSLSGTEILTMEDSFNIFHELKEALKANTPNASLQRHVKKMIKSVEQAPAEIFLKTRFGWRVFEGISALDKNAAHRIATSISKLPVGQLSNAKLPLMMEAIRDNGDREIAYGIEDRVRLSQGNYLDKIDWKGGSPDCHQPPARV